MSGTLAWHFLRMDADGKPIMRGGQPLKIGKKYIFDGEPILCVEGYHASIRAIDALGYAPGGFVTLVEMGGTIVLSRDKLVATERRALWGYDATEALKLFARQCALDVLSLWAAPDVVKEYLETGDEALRAAASAGAAASADAAVYAAYASASSSAYAAASSAYASASYAASADAAAYASASSSSAYASAYASAAQREELVERQNTFLEALLMDGRHA